jgi:hypothetical protein
LFLVSDEHFGCSATFWLEPEGYELRASRDGVLLLTLNHSESAFAKLFPPIKTLGSFPVDGSSIAREIVRALRAVESQLVPCAEAVQVTSRRASWSSHPWSHPYPLSAVEQLERALL